MNLSNVYVHDAFINSSYLETDDLLARSAICNFLDTYAQTYHKTTLSDLLEDNQKLKGKHINNIGSWALATYNIVFEGYHEFGELYTLPAAKPEDIEAIEQRINEILLEDKFVHIADELKLLIDDFKRRPRETADPINCKFTIGYPDHPNLTSEEIRERFIAEWGNYESKV